MNQKRLKTALSLLVLLLLISCKPKAAAEAIYLELPEGINITLSEEAATKKLKISTNVLQLQAKVDAASRDWLTCKVSPNAVTLTVTENKSDGVRKGIITLSGSGITKELMVEQGGQKPFILTGKEEYAINEYGGELQIEVRSNRELQMELPKADWLSLKASNTSKDITTFMLQVAPLSKGERKAEVVVTTVDKSTSKTIHVIQNVGDKYKPSESIKEITDHLVKVSRAKASSYQSGTGIDKAIDGDMSTIYHSSWGNSSPNYFPITLEFFFDVAEEIDYLIYYPRTDGYNGHFKEVEIQAVEGNKPYRTVTKQDFGGVGTPSKVTFEKPLKDVKSIKIIVKSGNGDGQGFAAASEIQFFRYNQDKLIEQKELRKIFTDGSASELKPGVTDQQISRMQNAVLMQIARHLKDGTYPKEYRIGSYRAWAKCEEERDLNHTSFCLSKLDNPTGIAVKDREKLMVMVGDTHGQKISLAVVNFNKPGGDGFGEQSYYQLEEGINYLTMNRPGLVYVMYNVSHWREATPIKVHIATGSVNGYYDSTKDKAEDFIQKLNKTTHPYFDVVGQKAHLVFPVEEYKRHTGGKGKELIDLYDWIVSEELDLLGINKYNRSFNNRAFFHVMYTAFMYATNYHTAYNVSTCPTILNPDKLRKDPWGTAHEQGHQFQTKGFKWKGMTEVSNNVMSLYIQTKLGNGARIQEESMKGEGGFVNRYDKAYHFAFVDQKPYILIGDVFCNLVPLWQLHLYISQVEGRPDFYKDLYEELRQVFTNQVGAGKRGEGEVQLDFTRLASKAAGLDLTEFFETWGFYRPMKQEVDDYGKSVVEITTDLAQEYKQKIARMGLPKPSLKIEYICDANAKYYVQRTRPSGTGVATLSGDFITIPDSYTGAVAYEYYVGNKLCGVSNNHLLKINSKGARGDKKLYAIAYDGTRTEIRLK